MCLATSYWVNDFSKRLSTLAIVECGTLQKCLNIVNVNFVNQNEISKTAAKMKHCNLLKNRHRYSREGAWSCVWKTKLCQANCLAEFQRPGGKHFAMQSFNEHGETNISQRVSLRLRKWFEDLKCIEISNHVSLRIELWIWGSSSFEQQSLRWRPCVLPRWWSWRC